MLIVGLLGAVVFYIVLYFVYEASQNRLQNIGQILTTLNNMAVAPEHPLFMIFRGLILVTLLYVVCDFIISAGRKATKKKREREEDMKITVKRTPLG